MTGTPHDDRFDASPRQKRPAEAEIDSSTTGDDPSRRSPAQLDTSSLIEAGRSTLLVVDVQERFVPAMHEIEPVVANIERLARAAGLFDIPIVASEQVPQKLGPTLPSLAELLPPSVAKSKFSAAELLGGPPQDHSRETERPQVVLCGIETHVCILQTAVELAERDRLPVVVVDATTSRTPASHAAALARLQQLGVTLATTEMVLFEWLRDAAHPAFREVSRLIR